MSGLEGIAALGLACNILQLIGTVANSITVAKNILKSGTIDPALERRNDELTKLFQDVKGSLGEMPEREDDKELRDVAGHILKTAAELKTELAKISGSSLQGRARKVIGGTIKAILRQKKLERLEEKVLACQRAFESRLLLSLRYGLLYPAKQSCFGRLANAAMAGVELTSAPSSAKMTSTDLATLYKASSKVCRMATRNLKIFSEINPAPSRKFLRQCRLWFETWTVEKSRDYCTASDTTR